MKRKPLDIRQFLLVLGIPYYFFSDHELEKWNQAFPTNKRTYIWIFEIEILIDKYYYNCCI